MNSDTFARLLAAIALVLGIYSAYAGYRTASNPQVLGPEVTKWVNEQHAKTQLAAQVQSLLDKKDAETKAAQSEVERLKKELEAKAPKGK